MKTCCFTGHRPIFFPWKDDITDKRAKKLISELKFEIKSAINDGYTKFLWGGALGVTLGRRNVLYQQKRKREKNKY